MIQKVIKVPFRKIKWIAHLADIHIRNLKRHKEYEECFSRLYEEIKKLDGNGVIYIGGDIVHAKTQMSPELVHQTSNFFKNLSDIAPTIVIAGNHDCNLNNSSRMDTLTPIINNINSSNLHYLKDSGEYKIADTSFVVMSIFDDPKDYIKSKDINSKNKIALFHGTVAKSKTDFGFRLMSDVKIDVFRGYDMALLGDIHKHQYLNWKKNIAYCGSLICQNHGEDLIKGFLIWDVPKRSSEFIRLENDYGYYTLDVDNGKVPDVSDMPKKARLRVRVANTDASKLKKALAVIHKKYGIKEISVFRTDALSQQKSGDRLNKITIGDITNTDYQFELIEDYLKRNYIVSSDILFKIKNINDDLNAGLPEEEVSRNVSWKIKKFEFDNMFSYGEDNSVDFTKLDGITGLFAANASGKSALLDSLSFCLFDTCSRAFKANNVLNNKKKKFKCRVNFEVGEQDYFIERVAKKQRNGHVKVNVDFWMLDDAGDKISLNGDQRRTTNLNIKKIIGTFDDFVLTTLSVQNNNTVFIDKTQKERKELLAQFMGIGIFDQLYTLAHEEISDVAAVLKNFKKNDYGKDLADVEQNLLDSKEQHKELKKKKREVNKEKKLLDKSILESTKSLKPIDASVIDIETFKIKEKELTDILNTIDIKLGTIKNNKKEYKINEKGIKKRIESYVNQNINSDYLNLQQFELERNNTKIEIDKLKIDVQHKIDKIQKLGNLEYDPNCSYCMDNIFVKDAIKTKEDLNKDKKIANELVRKLDEVDENILGLKGIKEKKVDFDQLLEALKDIEIQYNKTDSEKKLLCERKKNIINQIAIIEEKIQEYYEIEKEIIFNKSVESEIEKLQNEVSNLEYQIDVIDKKMSSVHGMIKVYETKKETIIDKISQVESLEDKYTAYEYYLDSIKRDGVPYELITKALPTIESEVNDILGHIVDFSIILEMDGKNINTYIVYDQDNMWPLELASGMERFVSSLALRVGLINVSNLPRTNFLAIDEGFGNMDGDNLNSVYMLFQYLKTQFQFVLIVSHIETMRDTVDKLLEIKKENNFSQITFN